MTKLPAVVEDRCGEAQDGEDQRGEKHGADPHVARNAVTGPDTLFGMKSLVGTAAGAACPGG
jgi:hypothetical protein